MEIPTKLTKPQFERSIEPSLSKAKRGYVSKIPLHKIFNYILYKLYTGCQWEEVPLSGMQRVTPRCPGKFRAIISINGAEMGAFSACLMLESCRSDMN